MESSHKEHSLLVEKYRPTKLENYVGNENIKKSISKYLEQNDIQNLIFYGPAGTGKTTLARLIVQNLDCDSIYICLLYTSPSPRDRQKSRMPSSA